MTQDVDGHGVVEDPGANKAVIPARAQAIGKLCVAHGPANADARHGIGLGKAVGRYTALVHVDDAAVGVSILERQVHLVRKHIGASTAGYLGDCLQLLTRQDRARGIAGVVDADQLGVRGNQALQLFDARLPAVLLMDAP